MAGSASRSPTTAAFSGMNVLIWAREATRVKAQAEGFATAPSKQAFFEGCDIVTLHLRLVEGTRHIVTIADLAPVLIERFETAYRREVTWFYSKDVV
jgi:phosphoglycerate dehydrogenase-like enzyme